MVHNSIKFIIFPKEILLRDLQYGPLEAGTFLLQVDVVDREADLHRGRIDGAGRSPEPRQVRPRQHQAVPGQKSCQ